ncbi:MAG TPA: chemotaxis protein CheW [Gammaproteobacteria bacterium]|nr:chemotaxis protein CheW [Gammaproteobacteria bacterium]
MSTAQESVRSLLIPLQGRNLLLPNVAVAEIVSYQAPESVADAPQWLLGSIAWRGRRVPLVHCEALCGEDADGDAPTRRIAVVNTVRSDGRLPFYAVLTAGIPRLLRVERNMIEPLEEPSPEDAWVSRARLQGEEVVIPFMEQLESTVAAHWPAAA